MAASTPAGASPAQALPAAHVALPRVFSKLEVGPLCLAACVARAWRTAAASPQLWRRPLLPRDARVTNAQLLRIVNRCGAHLQELDVSCCVGMTLQGVLEALRGAPRLSALRVRGVELEETTTEEARDGAWAALRACLRDDEASQGALDVLELATCGEVLPQPREPLAATSAPTSTCALTATEW